MWLAKIAAWRNKSKTHRYISYFLVYTAIFTIVVLFWLRDVLSEGNTLVVDVDTETQFLPGVVYLGQYVRESIRTFLHTGQIVLPSWDIHIGLGDDVMGALNQYAFGDILDLFYIFVPAGAASVLYSILAVFRMWLSGVAFSCYGFFKKKRHSYVLVAAILYSLNFWTLHMFGQYAYFLNGLIYLPLLVIALERLLVQKKKTMFTVLAALSLLSSFYFFFMLTVGLVVYALIFCIKNWKARPDFWKKSFAALGLCIWGYVKAILAIAVIFVPVVVSFFNSYRATGSAVVKNVFRYPLSTYPARFASFFAYIKSGHDQVLGMSFFVFLVVAMIFVRKKYKKWRWGVVACFVCCMLPVFSYAMNAGASDLGRWTFLILFFASVVCMNLCGEILTSVNRRDALFYFIMAGIYLFLLVSNRYTMGTGTCMMGMMLLAGGVVCFLFLPMLKERVRVIVLVSLLAVECILEGSAYTALYQPVGISARTMDREEVTEHMHPVSGSGYKLGRYRENGYRIDSHNVMGVLASVNYGWTEHIPTLSAYYSLLPGIVTTLSHEIGNARENSSVIVQDYDDRTVLNQLMSVKYIFADSTATQRRSIPFGYKKKKETVYKDIYGQEQTKAVYENQYAMPLIYGYDSCISRKEYEGLPMNEREQALLQGAVVEAPGELPPTQLLFTDKVLMTKDSICEQLAENRDSIRVKKNGDIVVLKPFTALIQCELPACAESYLAVSEFTYKQADKDFYKKYKKFYQKEEWNSKAGYILGYPLVERVNLETGTEKKKSVMRHNTEYACYSSYHSKLLNLGYDEGRRTSFSITFSNEGIYHFEDLQVIAQPFDKGKYASEIQARKDLQVKKLAIKKDTISAQIEAPGRRLVCVGIPYSEGWNVYVDDRKISTEKVNTAFLGFRVGKGKHTIRMEYETPGRRECAVISGSYWIFTLLVFAVRAIHRLHRFFTKNPFSLNLEADSK